MDEERFLKCEKQDWVEIPQLEQLTNLMKKMRRNLLNIFFSNCLVIMKKLFQQKPSHTHKREFDIAAEKAQDDFDYWKKIKCVVMQITGSLSQAARMVQI